MSYAAKGEKVFAYQDPTYPDCTPEWTKRSDHRLKRFRSTIDRRAWDFCEEVRYKYFYDLMSGSRTCLGIDYCHRYVPLEDLIRILTAEKDQLIKQLQDGRNQGDAGDKMLLQAQVAGLTEEVNKSRDMLRQAMHKLENIDEIVNENKKLQCRLRCSEERVKFLEEKEKKLESELEGLRSRSQIQMDLEKAEQMLSKVTQQREESTEMDEVLLQSLSVERNELQEKVKELEKELKEAKKKEAEIEMLKKQSQSDSLNKEEMCRENECYRRKLASMKCLEKQIQELKKQGRALADKYKRESQRAAEQVNKMCQAAKELQCIREERDSLRKRVNELACYECQYHKLQRKLHRVDAVIAENENLNSKLVALQKLEKENEYLRCRLEAIQEMEVSAVEDKEKIMQLQCAVADQEEEMKDLLCQIERLTSGKHEEELQRLRCELYEKNCKLKLCEEQLAEIPMLEAEIDELRMKLQCCCREFPETKKEASSYQKVEVRFPSTSTGIRANYKTPGQRSSSVIGIRREQKIELRERFRSCQEILQEEGKVSKTNSECSEKKEMLFCEEVQSLLQSSKGIISCVLEDMVEHQKEMEDLELCNRAMKAEIETLKARIGTSDKDCLLQEISDLRKDLDEKNAEIQRLKQEAGTSEDGEDIGTLRELNLQMKTELQAACEGLKQVAELERVLEAERRARCEAERRLREVKSSPEESVPGPSSGEASGAVIPEDPDFDCCRGLQKEIEDLKHQIVALNTLTEELKKENELLRELQQPCPDFSKELDEKCALENLLSLLQAELEAFKGQKLSEECEALRNELKRVMEQNCQLKALVDCYRQRLDLEKKSNQLMQGVMNDEKRLPFVTPSGQVVSTPSELKKLEEEKGKDGKAKDGEGVSFPFVTPSGQVVNTPSELKKLGEEKGKDGKAKGGEGVSFPFVTPSGQVVNTPSELKKLEEEKGKDGKAKGGEGVSFPFVTPSGQVVNTPSELKKLEERKGKDTKGKDAKAKDGDSPSYPMVTPSGRVVSGPSEETKGAKVDKQIEAVAKDKMNDCEQELKALRDKLAQLQQDNENLKNSLKEAERKSNLAEKAAGANSKTSGGAADAAALEERLKQVEAENAEKLKKLMEQHEKELADREKKCNENLNAMKAGYETDIRKLTERHKMSVMHLQGLHEDEVQEINTNYETQLETMQSQTEEAMSDVAKGSAAKLRKLAEKHAKEMQDMEGKIGELQGKLVYSTEDLKKARQNAEEIAAQLKAKHAREMQKIRRTSAEKLKALKASFEEERKSSQAEVEFLRQKIKELETNSGICDCKSTKKRLSNARDPTCPLDFNEVLEKILEQGLDALTFNEIALVHRKSCCALEGIMINSKVCPTLEPPVGDGCPHTPLLEADKQQLLTRIFALENDILQKQRQTQEAIISMELAIKKERCRLQEVKNSLQNEQQKNSQLKLLLSSQTKLEEDLKKERDKLGNQASLHQSLCEQKSKQLDEEIKSKKSLEVEVEMLKSKLKQLCVNLNTEKGGSDCKQANQMELMRMKLEQSLNQERRLALQLENEAKYRMQLQCQLQALRQSFKQMVNLPAVENSRKVSQNPLEAKSVKERQNLDQVKEKKNKIKTKSVKKHRK